MQFVYQVKAFSTKRYLAVFGLMMSYPEHESAVIEVLAECYDNPSNFEWNGSDITLLAGEDSCEPCSGQEETINRMVFAFAEVHNIDMGDSERL